MKVIKRNLVLQFPESNRLEKERELVRRYLLDTLQLVVGEREQISVDIEQGERTTVYRVHCTQDVIRWVMGKKGRTIDALRTLLASICYNYGFRAVIEIPFYPQRHSQEDD